MKCEDCGARVIWHSQYGNMRKVKKYMICNERPKQRFKPGSRPSWCPREDGDEDNSTYREGLCGKD